MKLIIAFFVLVLTHVGVTYAQWRKLPAVPETKCSGWWCITPINERGPFLDYVLGLRTIDGAVCESIGIGRWTVWKRGSEQ